MTRRAAPRPGRSLAGLALAVSLGVFASPFAWSDEAADVRATARSAKSEVTVGEPFEVEVEASGPSGTTYTFPPQAGGESAELVSLARQSPPKGEAPVTWPANQHRYEARVFALGEVALPALTVHYRLANGKEGEASAAGPTVKVGSLLPKDAPEQAIADIVGPVSVGIAPVFWAALALAVLLVGAAAWWLWRRAKRKKPLEATAAEPALPPADEALRALDRLARSEHFARGEGREFYIGLSLVAKRYLERRLGAPIVEMTSAEMLAYLRDSPHSSDLLAPMRDLALAADQVKFARGLALREEGERHLAAARALVERLEERLRPRPASSDGKAA